jgi:hypothetical protein
LTVSGGEAKRVLRLTQTGDGQMWLKGTLISGEAGKRGFVFQTRMQRIELARIVANAQPEDAGSAANGKGAGPFQAQRKRRQARHSPRCGAGKIRDGTLWHLSEKLDGQMQVGSAAPTRAAVWHRRLHLRNVLQHQIPRRIRQFDRTEDAPRAFGDNFHLQPLDCPARSGVRILGNRVRSGVRQTTIDLWNDHLPPNPKEARGPELSSNQVSLFCG